MSAAILMALLAAILTAMAHVLAKESLPRQDYGAFLIIRMAAAAVATGLLFLLLGDPVAPEAASRAAWGALAAVSLLPILVNLVLFRGMKRLPVNVAVPLFHSYPAITYLLQVAALGVLFRAPAFAGVLLVVAGVAGFSARRRGGTKRLDPAGIGLVLTGSVFMAVATVSWKALQAHFGKLLIAFGGGLVSTLAVLLLYAPRLRRLHWGDRRAVLGTAASGVLVFGFANVLSLTAMQTLEPALVFAIVATSVLWTAVISFLRLGERWTLFQFVAACLVVGGIFLMSRFPAADSPQPLSPQEIAKEKDVSFAP